MTQHCSSEEFAGRRRLLAKTNQAYVNLRANPEMWEQERQERSLWEGSLADGLEVRDQDS